MDTPSKGDPTPSAAAEPLTPPRVERVEMTPADYLKILLDSSFKESATMWTRTAALLTFNSVILGFFLNFVRDDFSRLGHTATLLFSILGIYVGLLNVFVVRVSAHYNFTWYNSYVEWVRLQRSLSTYPETQNPWLHLSNHINRHDTLPFPRLHSSGIATILSSSLIFIWTGIFIVYMVKTGVPEMRMFLRSLC
jgi:hypothetical protein